MIAEIIERLTRRKVEVARQEATYWQEIVVGLADGNLVDTDLVLLELDRLNKSPDDLAAAVSLLAQRRAWAATAAAGVQAEIGFIRLMRAES